MTTTIDKDFNSLKVTELRQLLRERYPQTRGTFSAAATKEQCIKILDGTHSPEEIMMGELNEGDHEVGGTNLGWDRTTQIESVGGKIKIADVLCPIINPGHAAVPAIDKDYRFDYWIARRKCGHILFEQEAKDLVKLLTADYRCLLCGPPSVGKTSAVEQFAARCSWPTTRFNGNRDVTMQDFVGTYEARDGATVWVDGPLPTAMKNGHILILDEVDHMPAECSSALHSVLEKRGKLTIVANGGEVVSPHANFRIAATANTAGFGDESGLHPNAQVQDAALLSRFDVVFRVDWLETAAERDLLRRRTGIGKKDAELIVKMANDTRQASQEGSIMYPIDMRQTAAWAAVTVSSDIGTGLSLTVLNKIPNQDVAAVAEIAQRYLAERLGGRLSD